MSRESTLGADSNLLQRLLLSLSSARSHKLSGLVNPLLHLLLILELAQLGRDDTYDDVLVFGQELERLESAGTLRVVLEVECVDVELREELLRDDVVRTLGKVAAADEVAAT